jgi:3-oxoacyl-[acyl-carrier protein] reductase
VRERASQFTRAENGDVVHAWAIVMAAMHKQLRGQVAIVTGGSRGIGLGIARALVANGVNVAITGRNETHLSEARRHIEGAGPAAVETLRADVRHYAEVEHAIAATVARFGGLDILVNNAGVGVFTNVADMSPDQWSEVIDTNLTGVFNACHASLPHMRQRGGGYIINISSLAGKNAFIGAAAYCASKSGLNAFSEALMQEVRYENVRVTYIMPGSVATGFSGGDQAKGSDWKISPEDVAEVVIELLNSDPRSLQSRIELRPSKPKK